MISGRKLSRIMGFALLLQFITSFSSGVFVKSAWFAPDDMQSTMLNLNAWLNLLTRIAFLTAISSRHMDRSMKTLLSKNLSHRSTIYFSPQPQQIRPV